MLAEMRVPGEATLEFKIQPVGNQHTDLEMLSRFLPKGLWGFSHEKIIFYDEFCARGKAFLQDHPGSVQQRMDAINPRETAMMIYTSGTTGRPKGVIPPHRQVAWNAYNSVVCWQLTESDVTPIFTPLYHAGGLGAFLTPLILAGGTVVLHAAFDAAEVWAAIENERCTVVLGVPTIWKMLADAPEFATADVSGVKWFISGGAPLPKHLIDVYRERGIVLRAIDKAGRPIVANALGIAVALTALWLSPLKAHSQISMIMWVSMTSVTPAASRRSAIPALSTSTSCRRSASSPWRLVAWLCCAARARPNAAAAPMAGAPRIYISLMAVATSR